MNNVNLSIVVNHTTPLGVKTSLSNYYVCICADTCGLYAFSSNAKLGDVPAHLMADGCTFDELAGSEWAEPLIAEAMINLRARIEEARAAVA